MNIVALNIVIVSIDCLHAGFLGCYGNTWVATPHFDRLAAQGLVFDQSFLDHPDLAEVCRAWWTGRHVLERAASNEDSPLLPLHMAKAGLDTLLITDDAVVATQADAHAFSQVVRLGAAAGEADPREPADDVVATSAAGFFARATEWLAEARKPSFVWLHSRGMSAPWDAPYELRRQYADEDDPPPPHFIAPPCRRLESEHDPDELWGAAQAFAGQVSLVDLCLGGLLESIESDPAWANALLMVIGARGFPLGRRGRLGPVDDALIGELVQTPWLVRWPGGQSAGARSSMLVQPFDLAPTLADAVSAPWPIAASAQGVAEFVRIPDQTHGDAPTSHEVRYRQMNHPVWPSPTVGRSLLPVVREQTVPPRDRILLVNSAGERGLRTPAWYLRLPADGAESPPPELYSKPDDRWEVNDVAGRLPDIVAGATAALDEYTAALQAGRVAELPPLDESLAGESS